VKRMIELSENGLIEKWSPCCQETIAVYGKQHEEVNEHTKFIKTQFDVELNTDQLNFKCSGWEQFIVLIRRSTKQIVNDKVRDNELIIKLSFIMYHYYFS
jgi:hypothetical protein